MIIPAVCFSCGSSLSDIWKTYQALVFKYSENREKSVFQVVKPDKNMMVADTPEGKALKDLGLGTHDRICCARMLLSHVDISDDID